MTRLTANEIIRIMRIARYKARQEKKNHKDDEFHGPINYGNRFPDDWYWQVKKDDELK